MSKSNAFLLRWSILRLLLLVIGFSVLVVVLLLYLAGHFNPKVPTVVPSSNQVDAGTVQLIEARLHNIPLTETAVGSIRAVRESAISSKLTARVIAANLKADQKVQKDEVLIELDDKDLQARLQQANATLISAQAQRAQAAIDQEQLTKLVKSGAASPQEYDKADAKLKSATAEVQRLEQVINEAKVILEYATIRAPFTGTVVDKKVTVGDMVMPGQVLLTLYDPTHMQLVASVRESLAQHLKVGQDIGVHVDVLARTCSGQISEIVPEAQSASRSFQVKVTGPCPSGIYTGMFGRLLIPTGSEQVLVIPQNAVRKVGQVELVDVLLDGQLQRRAVRTGRVMGEDVEILSGLEPGQKVSAAPIAEKGA
jgi:RND family efflux transporter MFP subunit